MKKKVVLIAMACFLVGESVWMREHEYEYGIVVSGTNNSGRDCKSIRNRISRDGFPGREG